MTVRTVLLGQSGLAVVLPRLGSRSLTEWIDWLRGQPLRFRPGSGRDRGHGRFLLAAHLLERASGAPWIDYLERAIFAPLGMRATGLDRSHPARATPYFRGRDRRLGRPASFAPLSTPDVAHGLMSTVGDMHRLDRALRSGSLVSKDLMEELEAQQRGGIWSESYGQLGHGPHGTADGWYTGYTRTPHGDEQILVLAFSNMGGFQLSDVMTQLRLIAMSWPPPRTRVDASLLARYVGRYSRRDSNSRRTVTTTIAPGPDGTLRFSWTVSPNEADHRRRFSFVPFADDRFYGTGAMSGVTLRFVLGAEPADDRLLVEYVNRARPTPFVRAS
jgi:CubicO group peptidase (beta-lactamase class C family)